MRKAKTPETSHGATAVINHRVLDDKHEEYEIWLGEIVPLCKSFPGHLDWQVIRPIHGVTETYTVIIRFDTEAHVKAWMESTERSQLIDKVSHLLVKGDDFFVSSGLDFWFTPSEAKAKIPVRWKQYLVTWSAIYPLALFVPMGLLPLLHWLGLPKNHYLEVLCVTGTLAGLMIYVVMPRYTRLLQHWLFK